jgi:excisionase family DNA binding protein
MKENANVHHVESSQLGNRLAFTAQETADLLGVSPETVYRLIKRGKLRSSNALRHKLIPRTEIERFLKSSLDSEWTCATAE